MRLVRRIIRLYQSFIISGTIVLFCLIAIFVGIIPGAQKIYRMVTGMYEQMKTVQKLREKINILNSLDTQLLESYAAAAITAVPADKSLGTIFSTIDGLTTQEGVAVGGISLSSIGAVATEAAQKQTKDEQQIGVNIVPFSIIVVGPIEQVRNVVEKAVKIRRLFRIRNFDLSFDNSSGTTKSTIQMDAYYVPLPKNLGKMTDVLKPLSDEEVTIVEKISALPLVTRDAPVSTESTQMQTGPRSMDPFSP
jgi:hypothetical protein